LDTVAVFSPILLAFSVLVYLAFPNPILLGLFAAFFVSGLRIGGFYVLSNGVVIAAALVGTAIGLSRRASPAVRVSSIVLALVVGATVAGIGASAYGLYAAGFNSSILRQQPGGQAAVTCVRGGQVVTTTEVTYPPYDNLTQLLVSVNQICYSSGATPVVSWGK
jgi:hypothetical protein